MTPDSPLTPDSRRSFVKKSLAASIIAAQPTILAGLIRAEGGGGGGTTETTDPWETTYDTTFETTIEETTTEPETTDPQSTEVEKSKLDTSQRIYRKQDGTWTTNVNQAGLFGSPYYGSTSPNWDENNIPDSDTWGNETIDDSNLWPTPLTAEWIPGKDANEATATGNYSPRDPEFVVSATIEDVEVNGVTFKRVSAIMTLVYDYP